MVASGQVRGTLLCLAGPHRIAFLAQEVAAIGALAEHADRMCPARRAFSLCAEGASRVLVCSTGGGVGVDSLEIDAESRPLLPPSPVVARASGGSLRGFVLAQGALWPLVDLAGFDAFLRGLSPEGA